ncbi:MAG: bifunctional phosphoribosylaminoimidazolecarboxamide formyltransferase/IMP cyclohydrolase [Bacteroidales bacterium]|jgi:phosphoribosylaminoimidazolecarboxamide formyltransferase/IMP cyclohydrolase|nr:bifunctional phosphoribosylaminoimidazolecarboxamide formyltransferase/IMP cyclohydrolase [Bacteroidales bacterium]
MKRVLISVSDKTGLLPFVEALIRLGYEIISTGGTRKMLSDSGLPVKGISEITGFPEIMDGRVKTLHPKIHGGILSVRSNESHQTDMRENKIAPIDMVVVNLYPFRETVAREDVTLEDAIENIDIGGPSMLRGAAKNHAFVTVLCDHADYDLVLEELRIHGDTTFETRARLAAKVFRHTASYDAAIADYLTQKEQRRFPEQLTLSFTRKQNLRYGENPHQNAAFYAGKSCGYSMAWATQIQGKELSFNNIQDADAALQMVREFSLPAAIAVKHKNPCGAGIGHSIMEAWTRAYEADTVSIFGGIVAFNREVTHEIAQQLKPIFLEIILAPSFAPEALEILSAKKNLRLMTCDMNNKQVNSEIYTFVNGGLLVQDIDTREELPIDLTCVTEKQPSETELEDLLFAMKICKHVKSNAIVLAKGGMTLGVGAGQMNRVGSAKIALENARTLGVTKNIALASDAFFPFDDVVKMAAEYGVSAIIQPGGSIRDVDSIKACNELDISMIFTGIRHFKH